METNDNPFLRLISNNQTISIPACNGGETASFAYLKRTFNGRIAHDFNDPRFDTLQPATKKTDVLMYEMYNYDTTLKCLFESLNQNSRSLAFYSQEQIETFVRKNKEWLERDSRTIYFLLVQKVYGDEKYFVVRIDFDSLGMLLEIEYVWERRLCFSSSLPRIVIPS